jgi:hypothetical protein
MPFPDEATEQTDTDAAVDQANFDNDPIGSLNAIADDDEPETPEDGKSDSTKGDETVPTHIQARIDKAEERAIAAEQTNKFLQGKMSGIEQQLNRLGQPKTEEKIEEKKPIFVLPTKEKIQGLLEKSDTAADTILGLFKDFGTGIEERLGEISQNNESQFKSRDAKARFEAAYRADGQSVLDEIGKDLAYNEEFSADCDKEVARLIQLRGGNSYMPGDLSAAAMKIHARWQKEGKVPDNQNQNGNNSRPKLRDVIRRVDGDTNRLGNGNNKNGAPKSLQDLGLDSREERVARLTMKRLGVSEAEFVKNTILAKQEDGDFGR